MNNKYIGDLIGLKTANKETWLEYANNQYNYKKNLEQLRERYLNKITWLEDKMNLSNKDNYEGIIYGFETILHDIEDILNELEI